MAQDVAFDARRDEEPRLRRRAVAALRHRHADRGDAQRAAHAQRRHARLRAAAGQRRARGGQPQELLRRHRRPDDPGRRQPQRDDHATSSATDVTLRNQTQYSHYTIDARESGPNNVGTLSPAASTRRFRRRTSATPRRCRSTSLYVGLGSHDRDITDTSLYNQTDLITEFATGPVRHQLIAGLELGRDTQRHAELLAQHPGQSEQLFPRGVARRPAVRAGGRHSRRSPATSCKRERDRHRAVHQRHDVVRATTGRSSPACATTATTRASPTRSTCRLRRARPSASPACARASIFQPTDAQSYYFSYGTSFNPSLETLALTSGQQSLDPETSRQYELGGKWDVLDGNLSLTAAIFQIEKDNTRSQISAGRLRAHRQHPRARLPGERRGSHHARRGRCSAATRISTPRSSRLRCSTTRKGKVPANTPKNSASMWTAYNFTREWQVGHRRRLHVGPLHVEHQRGQGRRLFPLGRDGRLPAAEVGRSSSTCSTSPTGSTTTR